MALVDRKLQQWTTPISKLEDKPRLTAAELKAAFDSNSNELKPALNGIIDDLIGTEGASNIGLNVIDGVTGQTVQTALQSLTDLEKSTQTKLESTQSELTKTKSSVKTLESALATTQGQLETAKINITSLSESIQDTQTGLQNANQTISNTKNTVDKMLTTSGASLIGVGYISGLSGSNVQQMLQSLNQKTIDMTSKSVCRLIIGTSTNGWTIDDCDYICDGVNDQIQINDAIKTLSETGGEVILLDGTYNISDLVMIRNNIKLKGNGASTKILKAGDNFVSMIVAFDNCCVENLYIDGNNGVYSSSECICIGLLGSNNIVKNNYCCNSQKGIDACDTNDSIISSNILIDNTKYGIYVGTASNNIITSNICKNNNIGINIYSDVASNLFIGNSCINNAECGISMDLYNNNNLIIGNVCNDNGIGISINDESNKNNTIIGNTAIRGTGTPGDYSAEQKTIIVYGGTNNLIACNNIMGQNYTDNGTGNTWANNKFE